MTASERCQWTTASERKYAAASEQFFYVENYMAASRNISMFF